MAAGSHRIAPRIFAILLLAMDLAGCASRAVPGVVKIGLVAPFEGRYREIGSDVIPAVRLAVRDWANQNQDAGVIFELVAYDDLGDPEMAVEQARQLTTDPEVAVVIGHWRDSTTSAALPIYMDAELPVVTYSTDDHTELPDVWNLSPSQTQFTGAVDQWAQKNGIPVITLMNSQPTIQLDIDQLVAARSGSYATNTVVVGGPAWDLTQFPSMAPERERDGILFVSGLAVPGDSLDLAASDSERFVSAYRDGSLGADPGPYAVTAYRAGQLALAIASVRLGLGDFDALSFSIAFDETGRRQKAPIYLYQWKAGARQFEEVLVSPQLLPDTLGTTLQP